MKMAAKLACYDDGSKNDNGSKTCMVTRYGTLPTYLKRRLLMYEYKQFVSRYIHALWQKLCRHTLSDAC
jgi:hypothetical protein